MVNVDEWGHDPGAWFPPFLEQLAEWDTRRKADTQLMDKLAARIEAAQQAEGHPNAAPAA